MVQTKKAINLINPKNPPKSRLQTNKHINHHNPYISWFRQKRLLIFINPKNPPKSRSEQTTDLKLPSRNPAVSTKTP